MKSFGKLAMNMQPAGSERTLLRQCEMIIIEVLKEKGYLKSDQRVL